MIDKQHLPLAGQRRKAREFALLGVYESLINKDADFAEIDAGLLSVITDADGPIAGCDLTPEDFDHCDQAFCREILAASSTTVPSSKKCSHTTLTVSSQGSP